MTLQGWLLISLFVLLLGLGAQPFGDYMALAFDRRGNLRVWERGLYRVAGVDPAAEQGWFS